MWFESSVTSSERETTNQIYANMFLTEQALPMPQESRRFMPVQQFIGLQVIDTKGSLVGNVKDVSIDVENKGISFRVATKSKGEMDFSWDDVQSVEDVVLLKKQIDIAPAPAENTADSSADQVLQALVICPSCGASSPARAKFCSKCGADLKS
jgi:sporulation protein YlmC with PRC-barrel domain/ribosomal protein L40E